MKETLSPLSYFCQSCFSLGFFFSVYLSVCMYVRDFIFSTYVQVPWRQTRAAGPPRSRAAVSTAWCWELSLGLSLLCCLSGPRGEESFTTARGEGAGTTACLSAVSCSPLLCVSCPGLPLKSLPACLSLIWMLIVALGPVLTNLCQLDAS